MSTEPRKRKRFTSTVDSTLQICLQDLSAFSRIPQSRLLDEALEDLVDKYKEKGFIPKHEEEENK